MDYTELVAIAADLYNNEIPYTEWRVMRLAVAQSPHDYAVEVVDFWADPILGAEEQLVLDADDRDIVINLIEDIAKREVA